MLALSVSFYLLCFVFVYFSIVRSTKPFSSLNRRQMDFPPQANANMLTGSSLQAKQTVAIPLRRIIVYNVDPSGQV